MPANTDPQFCANGIVSSVLVTAANTASDGGGTIGTNIFLVCTAGSNGTYIDAIRFIPTGTTANTATTATVGRIFVSTQASGATTSSNTYLVGEVNLPAQTADSSTAAVVPIDFPMGFRLPASASILVTTHAAPAANTSQRAIAFGGDY